MNTLFLANAPVANNNMLMIIMFVVLIGFTYFGMIRPQKKQQQKRLKMMDTLKKGDNVILVDGLHGKVDSINTKDRTVVIDADGIYLTFSRMAIRQVLSPSTTETTKATASQSETDSAETSTKNSEDAADSESASETKE